MKKSLLLFSGGQDSTTALAWSLKKFDEVYLISFDYGQRHIIEIKTALKIIKKINSDFSDWKGKIKSSYIYKINNFNEFNSCVAAMAIMAYTLADMDQPLPR